MKEFEDNFQEGLVSGLRRFKETLGGSETLVECHNLMPTEQGLRLPHIISSMNAAYDDTYILQENGCFLLLEDGGYIERDIGFNV